MQKPREVDDETAAYILQTRRPFEDLRQVAAQIAGFLVLNASGANTASPDHPMLHSAKELHGNAVEALHCARPTPGSQVHHRCLVEASASLNAALVAAHGALQIDPVLAPLRYAYGLLQHAANALPGFEMVAFQQGCCGLRQAAVGTEL
jgi:hypothetical protein